MPTLILRVLTLVALVLMPFGMGTAMAGPAVAGPGMADPAHHAPSAASAGHCDDQGGQPAGDARSAADCTACSMAIAAQARVQEPAAAVGLPAARPLPVRGIGLDPETATPPPKPS